MLLGVVERLVRNKVSSSKLSTQRNMEGLVAAHERIWDLRHPDRAEVEIAFSVDMATPASLRVVPS